MLEITNSQVYDLIPSVLASGYAMLTEPLPKPLTEYTEDSPEFQQGIKRAIRLVNASNTSDVHCHDNFLTGIRVSFDVKYPQYWTPEFQRYHFADIVTSSSKMHRLLKMDIDKSCNEYVTAETKRNLKKYIDEYNLFADAIKLNFLSSDNHDQALYKAWMKVLSNCPLGLELFMRGSTNYKQLQTIYYQRKHHKLKEDWGNFITFIESLPYFNQLILGKDPNN